MAIVGALALLLFLWGAGFLCWLAAADAFNWDRVEPLPPNWKLQAIFNFLGIAAITFAIVGVIGAVQMRQIPARWLVACFCFCFEVVFSVVLLSAIELTGMNLRFPLGFSWSLSSISTMTFMLPLLALAIFRPLALKVLEFMEIF